MNDQEFREWAAAQNRPPASVETPILEILEPQTLPTPPQGETPTSTT